MLFLHTGINRFFVHGFIDTKTGNTDFLADFSFFIFLFAHISVYSIKYLLQVMSTGVDVKPTEINKRTMKRSINESVK